jgi:hypothetical protein
MKGIAASRVVGFSAMALSFATAGAFVISPTTNSRKSTQVRSAVTDSDTKDKSTKTKTQRIMENTPVEGQ